MEEDKIVYSGVLLLPPNAKLLLKKTWQPKYCLLYKASKFGIQRLEIYDNSEETHKSASPARIITLENCIKVTRSAETLFTIVTKTNIHKFSTNSGKALDEWLNALQEVAFGDDASKITTLVEDNDLYCSIGEGIFSVRLHETEASIRSNLAPKIYILALTATSIQLREASNNGLLYNWPYQYVRRYGYSNGKFTFEAGRKCDSGEGKFLLEHSNEQEIFRYITMKMKSMKKLLKADTSSNLDCGEKQFQAVLNMEARSRSPLPPSPTTSTTKQDIERLTIINELTETFSKLSNNNNMQPHRLAPQKPPRKLIKKGDGEGNVIKDDYELISKYDEVEVRHNAWQTLGTTDIKHNEHNNDDNDDDEEYISWGRKSPPSLQPDMNQASKIIRETSDDSLLDYDKLNFFGSSSKLNMDGYKQVRPIPMNLITTPPSYNEYDEVHILECIRPADDSHLGYAVVRKKEQLHVDHKSINDTEYAVISKPKRV